MQTTTRIKIEIVVEAPVVRRVEAILSEEGVKGWSVLACQEGAGQHGGWRAEGVAAADRKFLLWALTSPETSEKVLDRLSAFFQDYPGVVCLSEVRVMRAERF